MILTVTPNPALDVTYRVVALEPGESHRVASPVRRAGGKGINVARVIAQTGGHAMALATAGGMAGTRLAADLLASGLPHELVPVAAETRTSIAIVDETAAHATMLNEAGHPLTIDEWEHLGEAADRLSIPAQCLVGSGSLPTHAPEGFFASLVAIARDRGIPSIVDTSGPGLVLAARAGANVLKPNRRELAETTGESDPLDGAAQLIGLGAGLVFVSLGEKGMLALSASDPSRPLRARLDAPLRGNATGAGDAAVAAIASCLAQGERDPSVILARAVAWSAAAVLAPVAGELGPGFDEFERSLVVSPA
ncbi:1-phosphofructokinase family hexose kinase [Diaminobutyricibacter sp. McL0618]|uniref:1-phosphofructokinase family hexose kinase n=1 Tax=Leifsonia sp. McL0618 TaxID=3415677 RepID=UPI003CF6C58F